MKGKMNPQWRESEVKCEFCGKSFHRPPSSIKKHIFCSKECYNNWIKKVRKSKEVNCTICGKPFIASPTRLRRNKRFFCSYDCEAIWLSINIRGENNPSWKGGYRFYKLIKWKEIRQKVLERDNWKCRVCGMTNSEHIEKFGFGLHVHHIIPRLKNGSNEPSNLISLCNDCHIKAERGELSISDVSAEVELAAVTKLAQEL
jgi:5-methylcytosine-specific restriction endonuclease McrA